MEADRRCEPLRRVCDAADWPFIADQRRSDRRPELSSASTVPTFPSDGWAPGDRRRGRLPLSAGASLADAQCSHAPYERLASGWRSRCCWCARSAAHADYTRLRLRAYRNEGVFSAVLPPGGSVTHTGAHVHLGQRAACSAGAVVSVNGSKGSRGAWEAERPPGWRSSQRAFRPPGITAASINDRTSPWGGGVYWAGGGQEIPTELNAGGSWSGLSPRTSGFSSCAARTPCGGTTRGHCRSRDSSISRFMRPPAHR